MKKAALFLALCLLAAPLAGCGSAGGPANLLPSNTVLSGELNGGAADAVTEFSRELLLASASGEGVLLSPLSALFALGMTANGAEGGTLEQMEDVFGLTAGELNVALAALAGSMGEQAAAANAIWVNADGSFTPEEAFLELCGRYYDAGLFAEPFEQGTVPEINGWVSEHTDGLIEEILDEMA